MSDQIAAVQNRIGIGGRSKVLAEAIRTLARDGTPVDVLTLSDSATFEQFCSHYQLEKFDMRHRQYAGVLPRSIGTVYEQILLSYLIKDELTEYDTIFNSNNCLQFLPSGIQCINYVHQPIPAIPDITNRYHDSLLLQAYALPMRLIYALGSEPELDEMSTVTNSAFVAGEFEKHFNQRPDDIVYPPCIETVDCSPTADSGVVALGSFHPNKRQLLQIQVAEQLPEMQFTIIGRKKSEKYYGRCEQVVEDRGLDNVRLLPNASSETVTRELEENRLFLHMMRWEEFGISIVEAMNHGCIPVVHDTGGPREIVPTEALRFRRKSECIEQLRIYAEQDPDFWTDCSTHLEKFTNEYFREKIRALAERPAGPESVC